MKTSKEWWDETKNDQEKLNDWLSRQYRGEVRAAIEVRELLDREMRSIDRWQIEDIAQDEARHAGWIKKLLVARGIEPKTDQENSSNRYWSEIKNGDFTFDELCAMGSFAEKMRLERIRVISKDKTAPADIRETFQKILVDEEKHAATFDRMSSKEAKKKMLPYHESGMVALGLTI